MKQSLTFLLLVLVSFGFSDRLAYASTDRPAERSSSYPTQLDNLLPDTLLVTREPTDVERSEIKLYEKDNGQTNVGGGQNASRHHGHFLRNALIGVAAMLGLVIVIAVAAKK